MRGETSIKGGGNEELGVRERREEREEHVR